MKTYDKISKEINILKQDRSDKLKELEFKRRQLNFICNHCDTVEKINNTIDMLSKKKDELTCNKIYLI